MWMFEGISPVVHVVLTNLGQIMHGNGEEAATAAWNVMEERNELNTIYVEVSAWNVYEFDYFFGRGRMSFFLCLSWKGNWNDEITKNNTTPTRVFEFKKHSSWMTFNVHKRKNFILMCTAKNLILWN